MGKILLLVLVGSISTVVAINKRFLECFTANVLQICNTSVEIWLLDSRLGTGHQFKVFQ